MQFHAPLGGVGVSCSCSYAVGPTCPYGRKAKGHGCGKHPCPRPRPHLRPHPHPYSHAAALPSAGAYLTCLHALLAPLPFCWAAPIQALQVAAVLLVVLVSVVTAAAAMQAGQVWCCPATGGAKRHPCRHMHARVQAHTCACPRTRAHTHTHTLQQQIQPATRPPSLRIHPSGPLPRAQTLLLCGPLHRAITVQLLPHTFGAALPACHAVEGVFSAAAQYCLGQQMTPMCGGPGGERVEAGAAPKPLRARGALSKCQAYVYAA